MKLLLDQNLSPRLCDLLHDIWADIVHVRDVGLAEADDSAIWSYAEQRGYTIVSKDSDFNARSSVFGAPPKVIWFGPRQLFDQRDWTATSSPSDGDHVFLR